MVGRGRRRCSSNAHGHRSRWLQGRQGREAGAAGAVEKFFLGALRPDLPPSPGGEGGRQDAPSSRILYRKKTGRTGPCWPATNRLTLPCRSGERGGVWKTAHVGVSSVAKCTADKRVPAISTECALDQLDEVLHRKFIYTVKSLKISDVVFLLRPASTANPVRLPRECGPMLAPMLSLRLHLHRPRWYARRGSAGLAPQLLPPLAHFAGLFLLPSPLPKGWRTHAAVCSPAWPLRGGR